jgi:hypothetical protein
LSSLLAACGDRQAPPVVTSIDTLCTVTTRYHASPAQRAAFKADEPTWGSLVDWLLEFNKVRDRRCLQPSPY